LKGFKGSFAKGGALLKAGDVGDVSFVCFAVKDVDVVVFHG
jgi:hypothetical protein